MMQQKIAFVIGAGASHDLHPDFALGGELLQQISDRVTDRTSPDSPYLSALLRRSGFDQSICEDFVKYIDAYKDDSRLKDIASIDGFIDEISLYPEFRAAKEDFKRIAKFSIVFHILGYEGKLKNSGLQQDSWMHELATYIERNGILEDEKINSRNLRIVTFNYDRNIEYFLYHHELFKTKKEKIKRFIDKCVMHVYGKIGDLEWQNSDEHFAFGEDNTDVEKILDNKDKIDLMFDERLADYREPFNSLWEFLHATTLKVCCFGFSFDLINHRLLALQDLGSNNNQSRLIANIHPGTDDFERRRLMANRVRNVKHDVQLTYMSCTEFLKFVLP